MSADLTQEILQRMEGTASLWLFLDYDGTLAEFAPTPDQIFPDPEVIGLIRQLAAHPKVRVAIISGRPLRHIQALLPVPGIVLAGTYGIEMQEASGKVVQRHQLGPIRPVLEAIKTGWSELIAGKQGFFLEDKGWAVALHARFAGEAEASEVLATAYRLVHEIGWGEGFRVLGGFRFLEIGPAQANKGQTVNYLLERVPWPGAVLVYVGDDERDEEAFGAIRPHGGIGVVVASAPRQSLAQYRLGSPVEVRAWLRDLVKRLEESAAFKPARV